MTRSLLVIVGAACLSNPSGAGAQHHHYGQRASHSQGFSQPVNMNSPFAYPGMGFGPNFGHHHRLTYLFPVYMAQPVQMTAYSYPIVYAPSAMLNADTSLKTPSTPIARLKSFDLQAKGDQRMREQKWSEARAAYANAISAAPDLAEAHFKLAVCFVAIQRFDGAIREFKRALNLDPKIAKTAKSLKSLFGPDSQIIRTSIVSKLGDWAKDDLHSSDRLFLYGAMLRLDDDPRSREFLESAVRENAGGDSSHIARFLNPDADPTKDQLAAVDWDMPALNDRPASVAIARPVVDLRFPNSSTVLFARDAPVPMPDGPVRSRDRHTPLVDAPVPMP